MPEVTCTGAMRTPFFLLPLQITRFFLLPLPTADLPLHTLLYNHCVNTNPPQQ
jgi:hypothetical protein